jgi:hypothetical protein
VKELEIIRSITGVATKTAAPFPGEPGDYRNLESYEKVLAHAGFDPIIHQSGKFEGISMLSITLISFLASVAH